MKKIIVSAALIALAIPGWFAIPVAGIMLGFHKADGPIDTVVVFQEDEVPVIHGHAGLVASN